MKKTRREFLQGSAATATGLALSSRLADARPPDETARQPQAARASSDSYRPAEGFAAPPLGATASRRTWTSTMERR